MLLKDRARAAWITSLIMLPLSLIFNSLAFSPYLQLSNLREPWQSLENDYSLGIVAALFLGGLIACSPLPSMQRAVLMFVWAAKCLVSLGFMLVYEAQYQVLDAYSYHELAVASHLRFGDLRWGDGTEVLIWLIQVLYQILPPSYHLTKVVFSFVGLVAVYVTWQAAVIMTGWRSPRLLFVFGLFPSMLFWSSILGKEPVVMLIVAMFAVGAARLGLDRHISGLALAAIAAALSSLIRVWMGAILVVPTLLVVLLRRRGQVGLRSVLALLVSVLVAVLLLGAAIERFGGDVSGLVESVDTIARSWEEGGSAQSAPQLGSLYDIITFFPIGAFTALFRPLPWEVGGLFGWAAGIENAILLAVSIVGLRRLGSAHLSNPSFLILFGVLLAWSAVYGLVSYQNLGTAARFKAQILPVMLILLTLLWYRRPVRRMVSKVKAVPTLTTS